MINLAGREDCDNYITRELKLAGINIEKVEKGRTEVPYTLIGKLGKFTFTRAWYYWVVEGNVPYHVAREIHDHPIGESDVRVNGHCGCPDPKEWITWVKDDKQVLPESQEAECKKYKFDTENYVFSNDPESIGANGFITCYHIDSELGLYFFVETLKRHKIV